MKTIVVPTAFSPSAENGMLYAGQLAQTVKASVLLLHVYQIPVSMNELPVLMISAEELKQNADAGLERAKKLLLEHFANLEIKTESRLGDVSDELNEVCKEIAPLAIVIGRHKNSEMERFLFGSTALSIIRHIAVPVIAVPDTTTSYEIKNIALAIDGEVINAYQKVKEFSDNLHARLEVIHVKTNTDEFEPGKFWNDKNISFHLINDDEFIHGIQSHLEKSQIDLLIILPRKHGLMERLLLKTHTAKLMQKLSLPVMCFRED